MLVPSRCRCRNTTLRETAYIEVAWRLCAVKRADPGNLHAARIRMSCNGNVTVGRSAGTGKRASPGADFLEDLDFGTARDMMMGGSRHGQR